MIWTVIFTLSRVLGKKVLLIGVGIGPFKTYLAKLITFIGLRMCNIITLRDHASFLDIKKWIPEDRLVQTFDLALLLKPDQSLNQKPLDRTDFKRSSDPFTLGISILSFPTVSPNKLNDQYSFTENLTKSIKQILLENENIHIRIYMFWAAPKRANDILPSKKLYNTLQNDFPGRTSIIPYDPDPSITLKSIQECNAFICSRYHSVVLAYISGCRLLVIPYHRKVEDLAKEISLCNDALLFPYKNLSSTEITIKIRELISGESCFYPSLPYIDAWHLAQKNITIMENFVCLTNGDEPGAA